uniref:Uncharacterized protein n=1 Tax=Leptocylindrus danicus TaxID=163516 RepID=A0A7S2JVT4_9STRA
MASFFERHIYIEIIIGELINAFLVAAVTEELTKYLVYRCVVHPDLMVDEDWLDDNDEVVSADIEIASQHQRQSIAADARDYCGRAACITIAMVCTAVGLACAENVVYVYLAGGTRVEEEIVVLLARSIFPIHALCAAIQSIGVIKRDVERDDTMHLGRITLPAILLHGFFDAVLMIMGVLEELWNAGNFFFDSMAWVTIVVIISAGVIWYYRENRDQKERLLDMQKKREFHEASERGYVAGVL